MVLVMVLVLALGRALARPVQNREAMIVIEGQRVEGALKL
jgi:hypothetical protein